MCFNDKKILVGDVINQREEDLYTSLINSLNGLHPDAKVRKQNKAILQQILKLHYGMSLRDAIKQHFNLLRVALGWKFLLRPITSLESEEVTWLNNFLMDKFNQQLSRGIFVPFKLAITAHALDQGEPDPAMHSVKAPLAQHQAGTLRVKLRGPRRGEAFDLRSLRNRHNTWKTKNADDANRVAALGKDVLFDGSQQCLRVVSRLNEDLSSSVRVKVSVDAADPSMVRPNSKPGSLHELGSVSSQLSESKSQSKVSDAYVTGLINPAPASSGDDALYFMYISDSYDPGCCSTEVICYSNCCSGCGDSNCCGSCDCCSGCNDCCKGDDCGACCMAPCVCCFGAAGAGGAASHTSGGSSASSGGGSGVHTALAHAGVALHHVVTGVVANTGLLVLHQAATVPADCHKDFIFNRCHDQDMNKHLAFAMLLGYGALALFNFIGMVYWAVSKRNALFAGSRAVWNVIAGILLPIVIAVGLCYPTWGGEHSATLAMATLSWVLPFIGRLIFENTGVRKKTYSALGVKEELLPEKSLLSEDGSEAKTRSGESSIDVNKAKVLALIVEKYRLATEAANASCPGFFRGTINLLTGDYPKSASQLALIELKEAVESGTVTDNAANLLVINNKIDNKFKLPSQLITALSLNPMRTGVSIGGEYLQFEECNDLDAVSTGGASCR